MLIMALVIINGCAACAITIHEPAIMTVLYVCLPVGLCLKSEGKCAGPSDSVLIIMCTTHHRCCSSTHILMHKHCTFLELDMDTCSQILHNMGSSYSMLCCRHKDGHGWAHGWTWMAMGTTHLTIDMDKQVSYMTRTHKMTYAPFHLRVSNSILQLRVCIMHYTSAKKSSCSYSCWKLFTAAHHIYYDALACQLRNAWTASNFSISACIPLWAFLWPFLWAVRSIWAFLSASLMRESDTWTATCTDATIILHVCGAQRVGHARARGAAGSL
jgi:hypothetical protein